MLILACSVLARFIFIYFMLVCFIYSIMLMFIQFESINVFKSDEGLVFVIESTGLWYLWIYFIWVISCWLYDWYKFIISTINCFSYIIPYLIKLLYKDFEFVHKMSRTADLSIFPGITFMTTPMSNLCIIPYSLPAMTLHITHLFLIKD